MLTRAATVFLSLVVVFAVVGCGSFDRIATPAPTAALSSAELRMALLDRFGPLWFCDPDEFPISRGNEQELAIERFAEIRGDVEMFAALTAQLGFDPGGDMTDAQKLAIYKLWKLATAITFSSIGGGRYRFDYLAQPAGGAAEGTRTAGTIDQTGTITVEQQAPASEPICPICLARGTLIDGPAGAVAVEDLRLGDPIWTLDRAGRRVEGMVIALGSTAAPIEHHVLRVRLADGRSVTASPGHPLADGRAIGELRLGDEVDGSLVIGFEASRYQGGETFDLVVSGETGIYLAGGIPLGSTLAPGGVR